MKAVLPIVKVRRFRRAVPAVGLASLLLVASVALLLTSCKRPMKPQELFEKEKSGVVLIMNEYFYDVTLPNGSHIYFTGVDGENGFTGLTGDVSEVRKNRSILTGTGFFISKNGDILTNRHVVAPEVDKQMVRNNYNALMQNYSDYLSSLQAQMNEKYSAIQEYAQEHTYYDDYGNTSTDLGYTEIQDLQDQVELLKEQYREAENAKQQIEMNLLSGDFSVRCIAEYGIAYDNTYIGTDLKEMETDFMSRNPCVLVRESKQADADLALLCLKNKKTPDGKFIFEIPTEKESRQPEVSETLYMIGYNAGIILANTKKGVAAQLTTGSVTQEPDGDRLLYSIPTVQGSSGSPVVDAYGRLVAVNFAKLSGTDNFNFGVPLSKVQRFMKE